VRDLHRRLQEKAEDLCPQAIVHSSFIHSGPLGKITQMFMNRQTDKQMWYIHTMECYSAVTRNVILTHATWLHLKIITQSEITHTQKDKNFCFQLYGLPRRGKFIETKSRIEVTRG
jgi:hypothetical protein